MRGYVAWAMEFPQRFKLVYGSWSKGSDELAAAAGSARALFTGVVTAAQRAASFRPETPNGWPRCCWLSPTAPSASPWPAISRPPARGRATPAELADDLLAYLGAAARSR